MVTKIGLVTDSWSYSDVLDWVTGSDPTTESGKDSSTGKDPA